MSGAVTNRTYRVWGNRDYRFKYLIFIKPHLPERAVPNRTYQKDGAGGGIVTDLTFFTNPSQIYTTNMGNPARFLPALFLQDSHNNSG